LDEIGIDWRVVAFCAAAALLTGLLIGLVPGWRASRGQSADALKAGGRVATHGSAGLRRVLVVTEITLAVVTLAGAGMLVRSLWNLQNDDLGFDPRGVLTAKVALWQRAYNDQRTAVFVGQTLERLRAVPGVRAAGAIGWLPVVEAGGLWSFEPEGKPYPPGRHPAAVPQQATPGALGALGLPLIAGRDFNEADRDVAIVSERFAQTIWPDESALGKRFRLGGPAPLLTIVGVVRDIRARGFGDTPEPAMYFSFAQSAKTALFMPRNVTILARTTGDPSSLSSSMQSNVHALDKTAPVSEIRTLEQVVGTSVSTRRFNTVLLAGFAALALVLAGIGTYGVISYGVTQRSFEIGVAWRLARRIVRSSRL
jgi:predicted permease